MREHNPTLFQAFQEQGSILVEMVSSPGMQVITNACFTKVIELMDDPVEKEALTHLTANYKQIFAGSSDLVELNLINHGDCWTNNMM